MTGRSQLLGVPKIVAPEKFHTNVATAFRIEPRVHHTRFYPFSFVAAAQHHVSVDLD
jgi:hypothetical protein